MGYSGSVITYFNILNTKLSLDKFYRLIDFYFYFLFYFFFFVDIL